MFSVNNTCHALNACEMLSSPKTSVLEDCGLHSTSFAVGPAYQTECLNEFLRNLSK